MQARLGHAYTVVLMRYWCKVTNKDQIIVCATGSSHKGNDGVFTVVKVDPLKTPVLKIDFIHCRFAAIQAIQLPAESLQLAVDLIIEQPPFHLALIIPLRSLPDLAPHK